jgi:L-lactate dehydrogenase (cytochrome)
VMFRPRLLRDVRNISTCTKILGHEAGLPLFVAPAAMAKLIHPGGEKAIANGCLANRIPQGISSNASFPIEEIIGSVPKSANHAFFFQLYVNKDRAKSEALLRHVRSLGVDTVFATIDGPVQGKREADERVKADEGTASPISGAKAGNDKKGGGLGRLMGSYIDPNFTWIDLKWLRKHWDGKILVKGVQTWQDAKMAFEAGIEGIFVRSFQSSLIARLQVPEC